MTIKIDGLRKHQAAAQALLALDAVMAVAGRERVVAATGVKLRAVTK